ncbi:MAG TPA: hypothetical protein VGI93_24425 [Steroidobacteraceae bacterium]|jgi:hypothetical protein
MVNEGKQTIVSIALLGAWGCCFANHAWAGDTLAKLMQAQASRTAIASHSAAVRIPATHLDLAPPASGAARENSFEQRGSFPSAGRPKSISSENELPMAFSAVNNEPRPQSKIEQLARNFKREGLPVAKLFQSNDALVHIGLSPKGKPGLWLIKKLH